MSYSTYKMKRTLQCVVEVECEIEFETWTGCKGAREGGLQLEPDEYPGANVTKITATDAAFVVIGDELELANDKMIDQLEEEALQEMADDDEGAREDAYNSMHDES